MKQLQFIKKGKLQWREVPEPLLLTPQDAIVRPLAAGRCDLDRIFLFHRYGELMRYGAAMHYLDPQLIPSHFGKYPFRGPFAYGHEGMGEVVACGEAVKQVKTGDKVIVSWHISCGTCPTCFNGLPASCTTVNDTPISGYGLGPALGNWGGMVSDLVRVPYADHMLVKIPAGINPVGIASAGDNLADGWRTVGPYLRQQPGAPVLVVGGGAVSVGLYAAAVAVAMGSTVDYLDTDPQNLELARSFGANPVEGPTRKLWFRNRPVQLPRQYAISVDASASEKGLDFAVRALAPGGICTSAGIYYKKGTPMPLLDMYVKGTTFKTGISHARMYMDEVIGLVQQSVLKPEKLITCLAAWEDAADAFLDPSAKVVVARESVFN